MTRYLAALVPLLAFGCASADTTRGAAPAPRCFWPSQVSGFSASGPDTAIVRIGTVERWELTLSRGCPDVDWALSIGIRARSGQAICPGRPAEIYVPDPVGSGGRTCLVRSVRQLPSDG